MPYTDTQFAQLLDIIANSKLFSELTEQTTLTDDSFYASINTGTSDAKKIKIPLLRGFNGDWNASTNSPSLANGTGLSGTIYRVSVGASRDLGNGALTYGVDEIIYYNSTKWVKFTQSQISDISGLQTALNLKANLSGANFTGDVSIGATTNSATLTVENDGSDYLIDLINSLGSVFKVDGNTGNSTIGQGKLIINSTTASELLITNASKEIVSAPVATYPSLAELAYVKGVTSAIQTQIDAKQDLSGYKVYTALISQIGTDIPTAIVLENTLGGTPVFTRSGEGQYVITLSGVFTNNKVVSFISNYDGETSSSSINRTGLSTVAIVTWNGTTDAKQDGKLVKASVEIRVYD